MTQRLGTNIIIALLALQTVLWIFNFYGDGLSAKNRAHLDQLAARQADATADLVKKDPVGFFDRRRLFVFSLLLSGELL